MFIRNKEEMSLNSLYLSKENEMAVICGSKGMGVTTLITQFIRGKNAIYFSAGEMNESKNVKALNKCIANYLNDSDMLSFSDLATSLEYIMRLACEKPLIFVIDDFLNLYHTSKNLFDILKALFTKYRGKSNITIILGEKDSVFLKEKVLPSLQEMISLVLTLSPLSFYEVSDYFKALPDEEKAILYGVTGGNPSNILQMNPKLSLKDNLFNTYLNSSSSLFENGAKNVLWDFRELSIYLSLLSSLADGNERMADISDASHEESNICAVYLKALLKSKVIRKTLPYGDNSSKKARYYINDSSLAFYTRFINENRSFILQGNKEFVYQEIRRNIPTFIKNVFKNICIEYLEKNKVSCPVNFESLGSYWGVSPVDGREIEIDIMGKEDKKKALFASCIWSENKCSREVIELLIQNSKKFSYINSYYYVFSNKGYTDEAVKSAEAYGNIKLVSLSEMVGNSVPSYQPQRSVKRMKKDETYLL